MAYEGHEKLVELLTAKTRDGQLGWRKTVSDDAFAANFRNSSVVLSLEREPHLLAVVDIVDGDGNVVDSFNDEELDAYDESNRPWWKKMKSLHDQARRIALGSDKVLKSILDELQR